MLLLGSLLEAQHQSAFAMCHCTCWQQSAWHQQLHWTENIWLFLVWETKGLWAQSAYSQMSIWTNFIIGTPPTNHDGFFCVRKFSFSKETNSLKRRNTCTPLSKSPLDYILRYLIWNPEFIFPWLKTIAFLNSNVWELHWPSQVVLNQIITTGSKSSTNLVSKKFGLLLSVKSQLLDVGFSSWKCSEKPNLQPHPFVFKSSKISPEENICTLLNKLELMFLGLFTTLQ